MGGLAVGFLSMLDPGYIAAKERLVAGGLPDAPVPHRPFGRTQDRLSIIGFGGILVTDTTPEQAGNFVAEAVSWGVNYFDVAPTYGNAQERLGQALKSHRQKCFLACKTTRRDAAGAAQELEASLRTLQTDYFDLYQLHALSKVEEVEKAFGPRGAMEAFAKAKQNGRVRYLGFSAHSEEAAHLALDRFGFDSVLFPFSFPTWLHGKFGPSVHKRVQESGKVVLALKAMARQKWPESDEGKKRWSKAWYKPFDQMDQAALALRFTLHLPVTAMIPPGHWELFSMAVQLAQSGALTPLNDHEKKIVAEVAPKSEPIFAKHG